MMQLIVKQTGQVIGTTAGKETPDFLKEGGRFYSERDGQTCTVTDPEYALRGKHKPGKLPILSLGWYQDGHFFDDEPEVEVIGKPVKRGDPSI